MVTAVSDGIVTTYETFLDDSQKASVNSDDSRHKQLTLTQNRALQMLFDLKFVMKIFPRKEEGQVLYLAEMFQLVLVVCYCFVIAAVNGIGKKIYMGFVK